MTQTMIVGAAPNVPLQSSGAALAPAEPGLEGDDFGTALDQALMAILGGANLADIFTVSQGGAQGSQIASACAAVALQNLQAGVIPQEALDAASGAATPPESGVDATSDDSGDRTAPESPSVEQLLTYLAALIRPMVENQVAGAPASGAADDATEGVPVSVAAVTDGLKAAADAEVPNLAQNPAPVPADTPKELASRTAAADSGEPAKALSSVIGELEAKFATVLEKVGGKASQVSADETAPQAAGEAPAKGAEQPPVDAARPKPSADATAVRNDASVLSAKHQGLAAIQNPVVVEAIGIAQPEMASSAGAPKGKSTRESQTADTSGVMPSGGPFENAAQTAVAAGVQANMEVAPAQSVVAVKAPKPVSVGTDDAAGDAVTAATGGVAVKPSDANEPQTHAAPAVDQERLIARIANAVTQAEQSGRSTVRIRLYPPELGTVKIEVSSTRGAVTARIEVSTPATQGALQSNLAALRADLRQAGIDLRDMQVQYRDPSLAFGPQDRSAHRGGGQEQPRYTGRNHDNEEVESVEPAVAFAGASQTGGVNLFI